MRGTSERGLMCLGDVPQPHSEESVGQRTWKGQQRFGLFMAWCLSYLLLAEVG